MRQAIRAGWVLAGSGESRRWLWDACVVVDGGRIEQVDTVVRMGRPEVDAVIDLGDCVVTPGLIDLDALVDVDHLILDSWHGPEGMLLAGSRDYWERRRHDVLTPAERRRLRRYGLIQLALHGITSYMPIASEIHLGWGESADEMRDLAQMTSELGLRGWLGPSYRSSVSSIEMTDDGPRRHLVREPELGEAGLVGALAFADELVAANHPLITPVLLPCRIETLTPELMRRTAEESSARDLLVRLHSLQQRWERELIVAEHGCTPLDLIERTGLLGDRLLIPHALWTDRNPELGGDPRDDPRESADLRRIAEAGVAVIHCPLTTLRYGDVLNSIEAYRRAGITMALGTDSFPPDLIRGIDAGFHSARAVYGDDSATLPGYFDAATTGGATALRRPDLGRIEPGASADLTAFTLDNLRDGVHEDPLRTLVFNGTARNTRWSMVAGRVIVEDGTIAGVDEAALRTEAQAVFEKLVDGYVERDPLGRDRAGIFPPTYPISDDDGQSEPDAVRPARAAW